jgi:hypothetical protein
LHTTGWRDRACMCDARCDGVRLTPCHWDDACEKC